MDNRKILTDSVTLLDKHWESAEKLFRNIGLNVNAVDVLRDGVTRWGWMKKGNDRCFVWFDVNGGAVSLAMAPINVRIEAAGRLDILVNLCEAAQAALVEDIEGATRLLGEWYASNKE